MKEKIYNFQGAFWAIFLSVLLVGCSSPKLFNVQNLTDSQVSALEEQLNQRAKQKASMQAEIADIQRQAVINNVADSNNPTNQPAPAPASSLEQISDQIAQASKAIQAAQIARNQLTNLEAQIDKIIQHGPKVTAYFQIMAPDQAIKEFGGEFVKDFYVGEVMVENRDTLPFLADGNSIMINVKYYIASRDFNAIAKENIRTALEFANNGFLTAPRRPSTYTDILSVFDYDKQSDWREQTINLLTSAGTIAAGATPFVEGRDYSKAVALATGVVLPEVQKRLLWDIILHSQNLVTSGFKEEVEVPAGKTVHGVVFFPKGPIDGVIPNHPVYISSFDVTKLQIVNINGSLIQKTATVQTASQ